MNQNPPFVRPKNTFFDSYLGIILFSLFFLLSLGAGLMNPVFLRMQNIYNIFLQLVIYAMIAFSVVLPSRAKGIDLTAGAMMVLSGVICAAITNSTGSWVIGLLIAVTACVAIGAINGLLNAIIRIPSVIITLLVSAILTLAISYGTQYACYAATQGIPIQIDLPKISIYPAALILLILTFVVSFLFLFFTRLGAPMYQRDRKHESKAPVIFAYMTGAMIAALTGFLIVLRTHYTVLLAGQGRLVYMLFAYGFAFSSRFTDNRILPVFCAVAAALFWSVLDNVMNLSALSSYSQALIHYPMALIFLVIALIFQHRAGKPTLQKAPE